MRAGGYNSYFGNGSDCMNILDHRTGERRQPVLEDAVQAIRLLDALPEIDFVMSAFLPTDVSGLIYDRYQMEVMLNNTTKPIVFVTPDFEGCAAEVEMCEVVAGSAEAFQRKPFAVCYINVTSGLVANDEFAAKVYVPGGKRAAAVVYPAERRQHQRTHDDGRLYRQSECGYYVGRCAVPTSP